MSRQAPYYKQLTYWKNQAPPKKGQKFTDPLFPPDDNSILAKKKNGEFIDPEAAKKKLAKFGGRRSWMRASEYFGEKYFLFEDKIELADIAQGSLGDCYFLASCAAMTEYPNMVYQMFKTKDINKEGYFEVIYFIDGKFQIVIVDDYLPIDNDTGELCFAQAHNNELWVCILEKAWAKVNGGYLNIISGWMHDVLETFTGFPSKRFSHKSSKPANVYNSLVDYNKRDCILTCSTPKCDEDTGLVSGHAYTMVDTPVIKSKGKQVKLIKIRNTWGYQEWNGDWSDDSPLWGAEERAQVKLTKKDEGIFYMCFDDYFKYFSISEACHILYNSYCKFFDISGKNLNEGNVVNIYLEKDGYVSISLIRKKKRFNRELKNNIIPAFLCLVKVDPQAKDKNKIFSNYDANTEGTDDCTLTKYLKQGHYLIYAYHDIAHSTLKKEDYYVIKIDSSNKFKYKLMPTDNSQLGFPLLKQIVTQGVVDLKGKFDPNKQWTSFASQIAKDGMGHRVVYNHTNNWMTYKEEIKGLKNMYILSQKNDGKTPITYTIPPKQFGCIIGRPLNEDKPYAFSLKCSATASKTQPKEYTPDKLNINSYLCPNLAKDNNSKDEYYDFITLPLKEAKKQLQFGKLYDKKVSEAEILKEINKEYPQIMPMVNKLPKAKNDKDLFLFKIKATNFTYVGQVNEDLKREGRGAVIYSKGKVLIANFAGGQPEGKGTLYRDKELKNIEYQGEFKQGKKHGNGTYYFANGDKYVGPFVDDLKQGVGIYYYSSGPTWKGPFVDGAMHGEGTYTNAKGEKKMVKFEKGKQVKKDDAGKKKK